MKDEAFWKKKEVVIFALMIIAGILLLVGLLFLKGIIGNDTVATPILPGDRKVSLQAKVMDQEYGRVSSQAGVPGGSGQIPVGAALAYREDVPLYPRPTENIKSTEALAMPPGQPAGYVMESQVTGVRSNRDGTIWIVLAWKTGKRWTEMYAPTYFFQVVPGARGIPFFEDIKLIWEEPE